MAVERYQLSRQIRAILKLHFEDSLQSADQFSECAEHLRSVWNSVSTTSRELLPKAGSPIYDNINFATDESGTTTTKSFTRIWKIDPHGSDREVSSFCAWATILLHLMVHKAYCILYHPIFRDPILADNETLRSRYILFFSCL